MSEDPDRQVGEMLSGLGPVEPPAGALERAVLGARRVIRLRTHRRWVAAGALASGALLMVALAGASPAHRDATPDIDRVVDRHVSVLEVSPVSLSRPADPGFPLRAGDGLELVSLEDTGGLVHALYRGPDVQISVFRQRGEVVWERLPAAGELVTIGDVSAWQLDDGPTTVLVVDRGALVYTFVSESTASAAEPGPTAMGVVGDMPVSDPGPTLMDRAIVVCSDGAELFGLRF